MKTKKVKVEVLRFAGETGLLKPGSLTQMDEKFAKSLEGKGIVKIERPKPKKKAVKSNPKKVSNG
jgi:hypothetical protein